MPQTDKHLMPKWAYFDEFCKIDQALKQQKRDFDHQRHAHNLQDIPDNIESPLERPQFKEKYSPQLELQDLMSWRCQLAVLDGIEII